MRIEQIGESIARLRREKGVTQEALAAELGVTAQAVSKWETGRSLPSKTTCVTSRASFVPAPWMTISFPFVVHSQIRPAGETMRLGTLRLSSHARVVKRVGAAR